MTTKKDAPLGFEAALKRLEEIVASMEAGEMALDNMIAAFEEGQKLLRFCSGKLNEVEKKIEVLVKDSDGDAVEEFRLDPADTNN